ncbi:MAG: FkbM family methyltransferase [Bacteroidetes bacterium]|nr:MAG: FkbM family methyltransferase [Bacteroidota bacterium]
MHLEELLKELDAVEAKARGLRWRRLAFAPARYAFALFFRFVVYPINKKGVVRKCFTFFGSKMEIVLPADLDVFLLKAKTPDSEIRLTRYLIQNLKEGDIFVDAGAHLGFYSLLASKLIGPARKVYSIEASKAVFGVLKRNTQPSKNIKVYNLAVGLKEDILEFHEYPILYSEHNTIRPDRFNQSDWIRKNPPLKVKVEANRLDAMLEDWMIHPDFIKIDIEGAQYDAIAGLKSCLEFCKPEVAMAYQARGRSNHAHNKALVIAKKYGYLPHLIEQDGTLTLAENVDTELLERGLDTDFIVLKRG